jgi:hypothetical protein
MTNREKKECYNCKNSNDPSLNRVTHCDTCHKKDKWKEIKENQ